MEGELQFLSRTGPFSIPVRALTKKCLVSLSPSAVDFGAVCLREKAIRRLTLSNAGALPTHFCFSALTDKRSLQVPPRPPVCLQRCRGGAQ